MVRILVYVTVVFGLSMSAAAQSSGGDLASRLRGASPADLSDAIEEARRQFEAMTPQERAAAADQAKVLAPVLMGDVMGWWQALSPEEQQRIGRDLGQLRQDMMVPPELRRYMPGQ